MFCETIVCANQTTFIILYALCKENYYKLDVDKWLGAGRV